MAQNHEECALAVESAPLVDRFGLGKAEVLLRRDWLPSNHLRLRLEGRDNLNVSVSCKPGGRCIFATFYRFEVGLDKLGHFTLHSAGRKGAIHLPGACEPRGTQNDRVCVVCPAGCFHWAETPTSTCQAENGTRASRQKLPVIPTKLSCESRRSWVSQLKFGRILTMREPHEPRCA